MTKPLTQIGDEVREMTDNEHAAYKQYLDELSELEQANAQKIVERNAILQKLGLTADEIAVLFG